MSSFAFCAGCSSGVGYHSPPPCTAGTQIPAAGDVLQLSPRSDLGFCAVGAAAPGSPMPVVPWAHQERMENQGGLNIQQTLHIRREGTVIFAFNTLLDLMESWYFSVGVKLTFQ